MTERERELLANYESWLTWLQTPEGKKIKRLRQQNGRRKGGKASKSNHVGSTRYRECDHSLRPWEAEGVSRATYYRRKRKARETERETNKTELTCLSHRIWENLRHAA